MQHIIVAEPLISIEYVSLYFACSWITLKLDAQMTGLHPRDSRTFQLAQPCCVNSPIGSACTIE
jgi:hypothetical protein